MFYVDSAIFGTLNGITGLNVDLLCINKFPVRLLIHNSSVFGSYSNKKKKKTLNICVHYTVAITTIYWWSSCTNNQYRFSCWVFFYRAAHLDTVIARARALSRPDDGFDR